MSRDSGGSTERMSTERMPTGDQDVVAKWAQEKGELFSGVVEQWHNEEICKRTGIDSQSGTNEAENEGGKVDAWDRDGLTPLTLIQTGQEGFPSSSDQQLVEAAAGLLEVSQDVGVCGSGRSSTLSPTVLPNGELASELIQVMVGSETEPGKPYTESTSSGMCFHTEEALAHTVISAFKSSTLLKATVATEVLVRLSEVLHLPESQAAVVDPEVPLCDETTPGPLGDMRQPDQDLAGTNSHGTSLPSLWGGRRTCVVASGQNSLKAARLWGPESSKPASPRTPSSPPLTRSAPNLVEAALDSKSLLRVRAHIYTRLGLSEPEAADVPGQKGGMPFLFTRPLRSPRTLAPLDVGQREELKHLEPRSPVTVLPSASASRGRRQARSRTRCLELPFTRGGSEESGSSSMSSQGSLELEEARKFSGAPPDQLEGFDDTDFATVDCHSYRLDVLSSAQSFIGDCNIAVPCIGPGDLGEDQTSFEEPIGCKNYEALSIITNAELPDVLECNALEMNRKDRSIDLVTCSTLDCEKQAHAADPCKSEYLAQPTKEDMRAGESGCTVPERNSKSVARTTADLDEGHSTLNCKHLSKVNITMSEKAQLNEAIKPTKKISALHPTNQSFDVLAHKEHNVCNRKSRSNLRKTSTPSQLKANTRRPPDIISGKGIVKLGLRRSNGTKVNEKNQVSTTYNKLAEPLRENKTQSSVDNRTIIKPDVIGQKEMDLRSVRQSKRSGMVGTLRAKSAMECVTYKDMFQEINSQDEGPAIYEMFATPVYENLRASSYDREVQRDVKSAPPSKNQGLKKKFPRPPENKLCKVQKKSFVFASCKQRKKGDILARGKRKSLVSEVDQENSVLMSGLNWHNQTTNSEVVLNEDEGVCETHVPHQHLKNSALSVIKEALSSHLSETPIFHSTPKDKTIAASPDILLDPQLQSPISYGTPVETLSTSNQPQNSTNQPLQECEEKTLKRKEGGDTVISQANEESNTLQEKCQVNSCTSDDRTVSPVFQKYLDAAGEGALTDDLLRCLAEELISLERSGSMNTENSVPCKGVQVSQAEKDVGICRTSQISGSWSDDTIMWTKGEVLGKGAYGTVYCGLTSQGQLIAVKQVAIDDSSSSTAEKEYQRLQDEVDLLKTLCHPNIVGFLGTSLQKNVVSIFMEYVPGGSIASILLRFGPLPEKVLALYTRQILDGVAYLHKNRVIHRDLKGNNIMLVPTGIIKLIDFGCARRLSRLTQSADRSELIKSVHGTPYWMAPEVINETGHGRKSDIWSIGCTVFEMATGRPPLAHMDKMAALFYIGARKGLMPTLPEGFSEDARDFAQACLTTDQKLRPSAEDLLKHPFIPR